jgi:signal transduction histidine kinase
VNNPLRWPALSMSVRLLAVLVASLLISQSVTALFFLHERASLVELSSVVDLSTRAADMIALLDTLDPGALERTRRAFAPEPAAAAERNTVPPGSANAAYRGAVAELLQKKLLSGRPVQVLPPDRARAVDMVLSDRLYRSGAAIAPGFDILTTLNDGQPLTLRINVPSQLAPPLRLVLSFLLTLVATLCAGSYLLTRSISLRLRRLAEAADAVGRGLQPAPLAESGPPELRKAARAFNRMQDRLVRYLGSRTRVLTAMSHDLRTPITRLRLRVASVSDPVLQGKMAADLEQMAAMVQESLESLQGLEATESVQPVRVESLLRALQSEYQELGFPLEVHNALHESVPARPQALRRALANLIDNARQFATAASIGVQRVGDDCVFKISDNGPGIPDAELERVFEPFFRLESSRNRGTGGAGLGLSIARDIAHAHGGLLTLANRPNGGLEARLVVQMSG